MHVDYVDPKVERATFAPNTGMVASLQPRAIVYHDLLDSYATNPHHFGNPFIAIAKRDSGRDDVPAEVARAIQFVVDRTKKGVEALIISSNHDDMLNRWIRNTDWRFLTHRASVDFYFETAQAMLSGTESTANGTSTPSAFGLWANAHFKRLGVKARCIAGSESVVLGGVELGMHGDLGPNGARGSIKNLRRIGVRSIIGHSHSPGIDEGCYQVGTSSLLHLDYNRGPSSWLNTHCILHADGKRQLINIINGEWRL
jgi:hypothetical protein